MRIRIGEGLLFFHRERMTIVASFLTLWSRFLPQYWKMFFWDWNHCQSNFCHRDWDWKTWISHLGLFWIFRLFRGCCLSDKEIGMSSFRFLFIYRIKPWVKDYLFISLPRRHLLECNPKLYSRKASPKSSKRKKQRRKSMKN